MLLRKWMKKKRIPQNRVSLQKTLCTRLLSLIKKKKMQELENLLNSLIKRGWKPWGEKSKKIIIRVSRIFVYNSEWYINPEGKHIRSIVSLESGIWQFVCANALHKHTWDELVLNPSWRPDWLSADWSFFCWDSEYRLLESALIPEEELAQFLLDNIKVAWILN